MAHRQRRGFRSSRCLSEIHPRIKRFPKLLKARIGRDPDSAPRRRAPDPRDVKLLNYLEDNGEADLLPTTIDSYTRLNRYAEAENGIAESERLGKAMLNGFPAVNHGVAGCRKVTESTKVPVQVRHGTPDARLLAEITIAGGFTSFEAASTTSPMPERFLEHHDRLDVWTASPVCTKKTAFP